MFRDLSREVSRLHTGELVSTLIKLRLVVIDVDDVDLYTCCGAGIDVLDVCLRLRCLK